VWSKEQMMFIQALHTFSTSYFAGNVKITEQADTPAAAKSEAAKPNAGTTTIAPKKLECAPGQKEKVAAAINTYVKSAGVTIPAPAPAAPQAAAPEAAMPAMPEPMAPAPMAPIPMAPIPMAPAPVAGSAN
jgi:hypothetical protein